MSDLILARRYGWRYEWVRDMPADVYAVLIEEITREQDRQD